MPDPKIKYLVLKNLINSINRSVNSDLYRNVFALNAEGKEFDALDDGENSCAYFISCILTMHKLIDSPHAVVDTTIKCMLDAGWYETPNPSPGSVIYWPKKDGHSHIGFLVDQDNVISNSSSKRSPQRHGLNHPVNGSLPTKAYSHPSIQN